MSTYNDGRVVCMHDSHIFALMHIRITCCIYHKYMHKPKHNRNHEGIFGISCRLRQNKQTLHVYGADNAKVIGLIQTWNHRAFWEGCSNVVCMLLYCTGLGNFKKLNKYAGCRRGAWTFSKLSRGTLEQGAVPRVTLSFCSETPLPQCLQGHAFKM